MLAPGMVFDRKIHNLLSWGSKTKCENLPYLLDISSRVNKVNFLHENDEMKLMKRN